MFPFAIITAKNEDAHVKALAAEYLAEAFGTPRKSALMTQMIDEAKKLVPTATPGQIIEYLEGILFA